MTKPPIMEPVLSTYWENSLPYMRVLILLINIPKVIIFFYIVFFIFLLLLFIFILRLFFSNNNHPYISTFTYQVSLPLTFIVLKPFRFIGYVFVSFTFWHILLKRYISLKKLLAFFVSVPSRWRLRSFFVLFLKIWNWNPLGLENYSSLRFFLILIAVSMTLSINSNLWKNILVEMSFSTHSLIKS